MELLGQSFGLFLELIDGAVVHHGLELILGVVDLGLFLLGKLVAQLLDGFLGFVDQGLGSVSQLDLFLSLLILSGILLSLFYLLLDLILGKVGG